MVDLGVDVWGFRRAGLHVLVTGEPAFAGETVTDVLAAIVTRDPDWPRPPSATPPGSIALLLKRTLERDRLGRLADAGEARFQVEGCTCGACG